MARVGRLPLLFWTPRILAALLALLLAPFALDVLDEGLGAPATVLTLALHLVPTAIILALLLATWRRDGLAAAGFAALSALALLASRGTGWLVASPLLAVAALFAVSWWRGRAERAETHSGAPQPRDEHR